MPDSSLPHVVPLQGGSNFRDLGGYLTADGRTVRRGTVFRSAHLGTLTDEDRAALGKLGVRTIVDLRGVNEAAETPHLVDGVGCRIVGAHIEPGVGEKIRGAVADGSANPHIMMQFLTDHYRDYPRRCAPGFRTLFATLADGTHRPLVFHCTAGKDRTGGAAALVLALLGVPRDTIAQDFNMTERAVDLRKALGSGPRKGYEGFAKIDPEVGKVISGAHPGWILALLDAVEEQCGSVEGYARDMGLSAGDLQAMRAHLLD